ncbi:ATP-binding domain-containing protein [Azohydromonas lata]|uniref:ATP-binding domain-containing protein n=1 Tax=Azohydromonas lata TaxID=45677 RepID=A0ABU5I8K5_9BURK|nr:ATP-binding domain-containing protein [Azohydromonas lata]MDZ5455257.1 ATP-binding domain-containing protein [Azohydromonas lata]
MLSWRGRDKSRLLAQERLADWRLARFEGGYDEQGRPVWSDGELRIETVRRFKSQSADAVVVTEVDFEELNELRRNLLFVALTRARMHVELGLTPAAAGALATQLQGKGP